MKQALNFGQQLSINLRYCYSSRRATQNMSATRNSPTIGLNLRALPLSAVTVSLHYLPRRLHSMVTCGKTPSTITWSASSKICWHVIVTQQRPMVEQFAPEFRNLPLQARSDTSELQAHNYMFSKQWTWLLCSVSVISANRLSLQKLTQIIGFQFLISRFPEIFASYSQFPGRSKCPFCPPCGRPWLWGITSLVQSVNLIRAKKSITPVGRNTIFLASTGEQRAKFWKLVLDWVSKFKWIKQIKILLFKFQSSAFVF